MLKKMIYLSICIALLVSAAVFTKPAAAAPAMLTASCEINLVTNTHTCGGLAWISMVAGPSSSKVVTKISGQGNIAFQVTYGSAPTGWTVNIGDSATNSGYGGDTGTQSNDAELQVVDANMAIFGNDYNTPSGGLLRNVAGIANTSYPLNLQVKNQYLYWQMYVVNGSLSSPYLYALAGQADNEGPVNYDIYAAFNRTISGGRTGTGVAKVKITISYWNTTWFDRDNPSGDGDWESLSSFLQEGYTVCANPTQIQAKTIGGVDWTQTGETLIVSPSVGLVCQNSSQADGSCQDYQVSFYCPN